MKLPTPARRSVLWMFVLAAACAPKAPFVWVSQFPRQAAPEALRPGDRVQTQVVGQDSISGEFEVRAGGEVVLPVVGPLPAVGKTPARLAQDVTERLRGVFTAPQVRMVIAARRAPNVSVLGEVRTPGRYELRDNDGVLDALARGGGLTPFADHDGIYVIRRGPNVSRIRFRYGDLTGGDPASVSFTLAEGDVVFVE